MPPRGRTRPSAAAPGTPRARKGDPYVPFNTQPEARGTRTGMAMRENVERDEHGIENPDEFFQSSPPATRSSHQTPRSRAQIPASSPPMPPPPSTGRRRRPRMSDMNIDSDEEGADSLAADGLLDDEYEVDKVTPPPIIHQSSPNPPASVSHHRSRIPDESPGFRPIAGRPSATSGGSSSRRANGLHSPFREGDVNGDDLDAALDTNNLTAQDVEMDDEEDDHSQPIRKHRKSEGKAKGPHPLVSSGVPDSYEDPVDHPMDDDDDASDAGVPFDDDGDEPMDYGDDMLPNGEDEDEIDLEEQAVANENAGGDSDKENDEGSARVEKKRGEKRPPPGTPKQKRNVVRKSQLPLEGPTSYTGTFATRRSGRIHFAPLAHWKNERYEYKRGEYGPEIAEVVRIESDPVVVKPRRRSTARGRGRGRGRATSGRDHSASVAPAPDQDPKYFNIDRNQGTMFDVKDFDDSGKLVNRKIFLPNSQIAPKPVRDNDFLYQKAFAEDKFIAGGFVFIEPGQAKPKKPSGDNSYIFVVLSGAVHVTIDEAEFPCGTHSSFIVPRGNDYKIQNNFPITAKLFFAQGRKLPQGPRESLVAEGTALRIASMRSQTGALRAQRAQERLELDEDEFDRKWKALEFILGEGDASDSDSEDDREREQDSFDAIGNESVQPAARKAKSIRKQPTPPPSSPPKEATPPDAEVPVQRKRGRPRKNPEGAPASRPQPAEAPRPMGKRGRGRGRGRPRNVAA